LFNSLEEIRVALFTGIKVEIQSLFAFYNPDIDSKNVENSISKTNAFELWNAQLLNEKIRRQDNPLQADSISQEVYGTLEEWGVIVND